MNSLLGEATGRFRPRLHRRDNLDHRRDNLDRTGYKAPTRAEWDVIPPIGVLDTWIDQLEAEEVDLPEQVIRGQEWPSFDLHR